MAIIDPWLLDRIRDMDRAEYEAEMEAFFTEEPDDDIDEDSLDDNQLNRLGINTGTPTLEGARPERVIFDDIDEPPIMGAGHLFVGNPDTAGYSVIDTAQLNHSITMNGMIDGLTYRGVPLIDIINEMQEKIEDLENEVRRLREENGQDDSQV